MKYRIRRVPPVLRRVGGADAAADRDDPRLSAVRAANLLLGVSESPRLSDVADAVPPTDDVGNLSCLFPDEETLAVLRSVKPDYRPPSREEAARRFLSDYLLCASLLATAQYHERMESRVPVPATPSVGNTDYWQSRCRSVVALISSMLPSREKILLTLRYLRGLSIERAADQMSVSRRTAYRIHRRALAMVGRILERKAKQR